MRITSIDIHAPNSDNIINLSFRDPASKNAYITKEILGLDAEEITSKFYSSSMTNENYYDLSLKKRDIVVKVSLNPSFTLGKSYSDLRDDLYKLVASSRTGAIQLQFKDGNKAKAAISGSVTKFESVNFTKSPEVQITVSCDNSMLKALEEVNVSVNTLNSMDTIIIDNESTAPHGLRFGVIFDTTVIDFSIQDEIIPNWAFELNLTGSPLVQFLAGDELHLSSEVNNRYLYLVRGFDIIHLVDRIIPTSIWPLIFPGANKFICSSFATWDYITHYPTYWGV